MPEDLTSSTDWQDITVLLTAVNAGSEDAPEKLLELVYDDLRRLAGAYIKNERDDHTLQATALVHEAFIRLVDWKNVTWQNQAQFFAVAAQVMRRILVDHDRARHAEKRSGQKINLDEAVSFSAEKEIDLMRLEEALQSLETLDPRQAKIVELRFFGGLSIEETTHVLSISDTTVKREWTFAKSWFQRELKKLENDGKRLAKGYRKFSRWHWNIRTIRAANFCLPFAPPMKIFLPKSNLCSPRPTSRRIWSSETRSIFQRISI